MLAECNIKRHYDWKHADGVYGKLKGRNQELKVDLFKGARRTMLCLLLFGPLLKKFASEQLFNAPSQSWTLSVL